MGTRSGSPSEPSRPSAGPRVRSFGSLTSVDAPAFSSAIARDVELQNHRVMDQAVDGGRGGVTSQNLVRPEFFPKSTRLRTA